MTKKIINIIKACQKAGLKEKISPVSMHYYNKRNWKHYKIEITIECDDVSYTIHHEDKGLVLNAIMIDGFPRILYMDHAMMSIEMMNILDAMMSMRYY